jgi:hypothetical protein
VITDARVLINRKALLDSGYTIGYIKEIDPTTGNEVLRAIVTGSAVLSSETFRKKKADGSYEDIAYSVIKNDIALSASGLKQYLNPEWGVVGDALSTYSYPLASDTGAISLPIGKWQKLTPIEFISNGTASTQMTLQLQKVGTPGNLAIRFKNAAGTVLLTTSITATSITGTLASVNLTYSSQAFGAVGEKITIEFATPDFTTPVISQANYYNIGTQIHDEQTQANIAGSYSTPGANSTQNSVTITPTKNLIISNWRFIVRSGSPTLTILEDAVSIWNSTTIPTANEMCLLSGKQYKFTLIWDANAYSPSWDVAYNGDDVTGYIFSLDSSSAWSGRIMEGITTAHKYSAHFTCSSFDNVVLVKSRASVGYRTNFEGICSAIPSSGYAIAAKTGTIIISGIIKNQFYYLSDTLGAISTTIGTYKLPIWKWVDANTLGISPWLQTFSIVARGNAPKWTAFLGGWFQASAAFLVSLDKINYTTISSPLSLPLPQCWVKANGATLTY